MTILERYLTYTQQICELSRPAPEGFSAEGKDEMERLASLQKGLSEKGICEFVRLCAEQDGEVLSEEELASFDEQALGEMLQQLPQQEDAPEEAPQKDDTPKIEEPDGPRAACEVLLDCCLLGDKLFAYLVGTLKTNDGLGFFKLSQVATQKSIDPQEFLHWLATKQNYADEEEQACVAIMDSVLERLKEENSLELLAALISGDRTTFELFRCEAPELKHLPQATYEWFEKNYLSKYYPVRFMMRFRGVDF